VKLQQGLKGALAATIGAKVSGAELSTPEGPQTEIRWHRFSLKVEMSMTCEKATAAKPIGEHLLTIREAAEVLRLNPRTVREYVHLGKIEGRIIGGRWRFRRADLDAFFENAPSSWDFVGKNQHGD
jgi:excisionase family DNA binding protein